MSTIKVRTKTITPAVAQAMLLQSKELGATNRKVSQKWVELYANEMRSNRWRLNGDAIRLDTDGRILDGQHRLHACVLSGIPFQTIVMTGVENDTFDTMDCGRSRTPAQVLQLADVKYHTLIASIIRGAAEIRNDGHTDMKEKKLSNTAALFEYKNNSEVYDRAATIAAAATGESHSMTAKLAGSVYYYLVHDKNQDADKVEKFIREAASFDTSSSGIIDKLRKWNLANRTVKVSERTRLGYLILTWNAWISGSRKAPRFSEAAVEEMPAFITK